MTERINYAVAAPAGIKALGGVYAYLAQSGLAATLLAQVYLRVSLLNSCAYCVDIHSRELRSLGVSNEKIALIPVWQEAGELFDSRERAALAWAEVVTQISATGAPHDAYLAVADHFGEKELVDLTIAIGLMNTYNRLAISFRAVPAATKEKAAPTPE